MKLTSLQKQVLATLLEAPNHQSDADDIARKIGVKPLGVTMALRGLHTKSNGAIFSFMSTWECWAINYARIDEVRKYIQEDLETLHLVLTAHWYDMIASGKKPYEYREIKPYWMNRLVPFVDGKRKKWTEEECELIACGAIGIPKQWWKRWNEVCFSRGYTSTRMTYNMGSILIDTSSSNDLGKPAIKIELKSKIGE
jgi:predicted transcriptional regulator with HTH domain